MQDIRHDAKYGQPSAWETNGTQGGSMPWTPVVVSALAGAFGLWLMLPRLLDVESVFPGVAPWALVTMCVTVGCAWVAAWFGFEHLEFGMGKQSRFWATACAGNAALLTPLAVLTMHQHFLAVLWAAFTGYAFAGVLRRYPVNHSVSPWATGENRLLFASPASTEPSTGALFAFGATIAMEAALLSQGSGWAFPAALLAGISCFVVAAVVVPLPVAQQEPNRSAISRAFIFKVSLAFVVATLLLFRIPVDLPIGALEERGRESAARKAGNVPTQPGLLSGAILLADEATVRRLIAPNPLGRPRVSPQHTITAMQIPFSGEYWIRGWPTRQRPRNVVEHRSSPLDFSFDTVDGSPIHMQAHQKLASPVSLGRVTAIEVGVTNRDPEPEAIALRLSLRHSLALQPKWIDLAPVHVPPLESGTLRFPLPAGTQLAAMDEILVGFHLYQPRTHRSAKMSINWFRLESDNLD